MEAKAYFLLSSGRCGTQWLCDALSHSLPTDYVVQYEPIEYAYSPEQNSPLQPQNSNAIALETHLNRIKSVLNSGKSYVEVGFPCWRHLAWFYHELQGRVAIIHLIRHPATSAYTWLDKGAYRRQLLDYPVKDLFTPTSTDALLPDYQSRWASMSRFEKLLYFWAEVHVQALEYRSHWPEHLWYEVHFETMFNRQALFKLLKFICPDKIAMPLLPKYRRSMPKVPLSESPDLIMKHPTVLALADQLGYSQMVIGPDGK